eukprot:CAMPEP_0175137208 /NCGR_PEP_ID=MMETSP0087-20121206/9691_1 /TAXON_ID=136419 /ORGANISM="Unknown Unknown, Strain D1" /LENGTH=422 /DNA_ID=CAMNT_0016420025 /DNA_START=73 /DNA_END=1341 /DNA_ORIENTATION=+
MNSKAQMVVPLLNTPGVVKYTDQQRVVRDTYAVLNSASALIPRIGPFVHNNGVTETMFNLDGTVPIFFRGASYNIPVRIWVTSSYPVNPPMIYVTPVAGMRIKARHKHVDMHGLVYLPYLNQWSQGTSSLYELSSVLSSVFSEDPPVYSSSEPPSQPVHQNASHTPVPTSNRVAAAAGGGGGGAQAAVAAPSNGAGAKAAAAAVSGGGGGGGGGRGVSSGKKQQMINEVNLNLKACLKSFTDDIAAEIDSLLEMDHELKQGAKVIDNAISAADRSKSSLSEEMVGNAKKIEEAEAWLAANESTQQSIKAHDVVFMKDSWSQQLLQCIAQDVAVEDALIVLDRQLADDHITLADFLKQIRKLARTQFEARALSHKIFEKQQASHRDVSHIAPTAQPLAPAPAPAFAGQGPPAVAIMPAAPLRM